MLFPLEKQLAQACQPIPQLVMQFNGIVIQRQGFM